MKKLLLLLILAAAVCLVSVNAQAIPYTFNAAEIDSFYEVTPGTLTSGPDASGNWTASISGSGWGDLQIGRDATTEGPGSAFYSASWADLSGYDSYMLNISNTSTTNDWFMANLYMNTGYTDLGEADHYFQNGWTWIEPGETVTMILDFSSADAWYDGVAQGWTSVDNLGHVSSIGFNIGTNVGDGDYKGDDLSGNAAPVPEPATLLLLGGGLAGLGVFRKKLSLK